MVLNKLCSTCGREMHWWTVKITVLPIPGSMHPIATDNRAQSLRGQNLEISEPLCQQRMHQHASQGPTSSLLSLGQYVPRTW
jgi:hypothetical protein